MARKNLNRSLKTSFMVCNSPPEFWPTIFPGRDGLKRRRSWKRGCVGPWRPRASVMWTHAWRAAERPGPTRSRVVWGPVDAAAAALAGCARGVESLCIVPRLTPFLVAAALGCIPHDVRAKCTDTADVLAERLGRSGFLDDAHVLRGGNGKRKRGQSMRVRLNETTYPAPRRKSSPPPGEVPPTAAAWSAAAFTRFLGGGTTPRNSMLNERLCGEENLSLQTFHR